MADYWTRKSGDTLAVLQERVTTTLPLPLGETQATINLIGGNFRMTEIQAIIGMEQFKKLDK